jgi:hypothetical protein
MLLRTLMNSAPIPLRPAFGLPDQAAANPGPLRRLGDHQSGKLHPETGFDVIGAESVQPAADLAAVILRDEQQMVFLAVTFRTRASMAAASHG